MKKVISVGLSILLVYHTLACVLVSIGVWWQAEHDLSQRLLVCSQPSPGRCGKQVTTEQIQKARAEGASDQDIHDTILIDAAFCMFNRYVDGLDTWAPENPDLYRYRAQKVAEYGYTHEDHYLPPAQQS